MTTTRYCEAGCGTPLERAQKRWCSNRCRMAAARSEATRLPPRRGRWADSVLEMCRGWAPKLAERDPDWFGGDCADVLAAAVVLDARSTPARKAALVDTLNEAKALLIEDEDDFGWDCEVDGHAEATEQAYVGARTPTNPSPLAEIAVCGRCGLGRDHW